MRKAVLLILAALLCMGASPSAGVPPSRIFEFAAGNLRIYLDGKCEVPEAIVTFMRHRLPVELLEKLRPSTLYWQGRTLKGCWTEIDSMVYSVDSEGELFQPVLLRSFKDPML